MNPWRTPWARTASTVFALAFAARLAFLLFADQPLLYTHQYTYFQNALRLAQHPDLPSYVLYSDEWRTWDMHWTIAPLYHLFAGLTLRLLGLHLFPLQVLQCLLDSATAVAVAFLGQRAAGRGGHWAGIAYALYWPAIEMPSWTLTENLHTPLFVVSIALLVRSAETTNTPLTFASGFLLGLSALARSVSSAFLAVAALWRWAVSARPAQGPWTARLRPGLGPAALVVAGGALAILPWTARNVFLIGEPVLIETTAFENIWYANHFVDAGRFRRQENVIHRQESPAAKRALALEFAWRGIRRSPARFVEKIGINFRHFFRPEGLQNLLVVERSQEPWRHAGSVLLDDLPLLLAVPLFAVFLCAGRASPTRGLIALWAGYYLFMVVVVFHNEIRYRSAFVPFAFAGAAGGLEVLRTATGRRRWGALAAFALGAAVSGTALRPYAVPAWRALHAEILSRGMSAAAHTGDWARARQFAEEAAAADPRSPRPSIEYGSALLRAQRLDEAIVTYRMAQERAIVANVTPPLALSRLLAETEPGSPDAERAQREVDRLSWDFDAWIVLETAWRELPPPRTDVLQVGQGDYGAVRGFFHPRGGDPALSRHRLEWNRYEDPAAPTPPAGSHRWTRHRAWLRVSPASEASAYTVTLEMGAPFPSTLVSPVVTVRAPGKAAVRVTLDGTVRPYHFEATPRPGEPLVVRIDAPTWCRQGEPADQGIRVDRMTVAPIGR